MRSEYDFSKSRKNPYAKQLNQSRLTTSQKQQLDSRLAEGLADVKAGPAHGPFASAKEASDQSEHVVKERKRSKTTKGVAG